LVAQAPAPLTGGINHPPSEEASSSAHIYMFNGIYLTTRIMTYNTLAKPNKERVTNGTTLDPPSTTVTPPSRPLHIEKPTFKSILHQPKSTIQKLTFNPSSRVTQNYNIIEYLAQVLCVMSFLEVLQHFPSQHRTLLVAIIAIYHDSYNNIMFNLDNFKS
jgi:hypothetical protein